MNRYLVRAAIVDPLGPGDVIATVDTSTVVVAYNKAYAKYAAYDLMVEAGDVIVELFDPEFVEEV
jgi:hypothetical protein